MLKVRKGGGEEIPLVQGKEKWLRFAGAAMKRYPMPKVREIFNLSIFQKIIYLFAFGCVGSSLLCGLFSSCSDQGLLSSCCVWTSHCSDFSCFGTQALGQAGFSSCGSRARAEAQ